MGEAARILELTENLNKRPALLSGGQRQRVAMGRAIVRNPKAFLMDEPLSNLDAKLRVQMRAEIAALQRNLGVTTFYVTHDQVEAMTMGDRVAVIKRGILQQVDTPQHLYDHPDNLFVAGFIGSPSMNLMEGTIGSASGGLSVGIGTQTLTVHDEVLSAHPRLRDYDGRKVAVGIRPETMEDAALDPEVPEDRRLTATVELVEALGSDLVVHALVDAAPVRTTQTGRGGRVRRRRTRPRRQGRHRGPLRSPQPSQDRRRRHHRRGHHPRPVLRPRHRPRHLGLNVGRLTRPQTRQPPQEHSGQRRRAAAKL